MEGGLEKIAYQLANMTLYDNVPSFLKDFFESFPQPGYKNLIIHTWHLLSDKEILDEEAQKSALLALKKILSAEAEPHRKHFLANLDAALSALDTLSYSSLDVRTEAARNLSKKQILTLFFTNSLVNSGRAYLDGGDPVACIKGIREGAIESLEHIIQPIRDIFEPKRQDEEMKHYMPYYYASPLFQSIFLPSFGESWKTNKLLYLNLVNQGYLDKDLWQRFQTWKLLAKAIKNIRPMIVKTPRIFYNAAIRELMALNGIKKPSKELEEAIITASFRVPEKKPLSNLGAISNNSQEYDYMSVLSQIDLSLSLDVFFKKFINQAVLLGMIPSAQQYEFVHKARQNMIEEKEAFQKKIQKEVFSTLTNISEFNYEDLKIESQLEIKIILKQKLIQSDKKFLSLDYLKAFETIFPNIYQNVWGEKQNKQ